MPARGVDGSGGHDRGRDRDGDAEEFGHGIGRLYEVHQRAAFPDRWRDDDVAGRRMPAPAGHREVVRDSLRDLDQVLPRLTDGPERRYAERLREPARLLVQPDG